METQPEQPLPPKAVPKKSANPFRRSDPERHLNGVTGTQKPNKARILRAVVHPREGGAIYTEDVEPNEGTFSLKGSRMTYIIARGSVWKEPDGIYRVAVNEGNAMTINIHSLTGDDAASPEALHGVMWNNLWWQWDDEVRQRSGWKTAAGISMALAVVAILGVMIWMIFSMDNNLDSIRDAIQNLELSQARAPSGANPSGHQDIAPGGA